MKIATKERKQKRPSKMQREPGHGSINFHCIELTHLAYQARDKAREDANRPTALPMDALVALVMAVVAAEAFVNELPECIRAGNSLPVTPEMLKCADALDDAAFESIVDKYQIAAAALSGKPFDKGGAPLQDFALLVRVRNQIVHLKPAWSTQKHPGKKLAAELTKRK